MNIGNHRICIALFYSKLRIIFRAHIALVIPIAYIWPMFSFAGTIADLERLSREQELVSRCNALLRSGGTSDLCTNRQSAEALSEQINKSLEVTKKCQELIALGGSNAGCKNIKPTTSSSSGASSSRARANISNDSIRPTSPALAPEIQSYSRLGSTATVDAVLGNEVKRMRIGHDFRGWRLISLTDYVATFRKGNRTEVVQFRQSPPYKEIAESKNSHQGRAYNSENANFLPKPPLKSLGKF